MIPRQTLLTCVCAEVWLVVLLGVEEAATILTLLGAKSLPHLLKDLHVHLVKAQPLHNVLFVFLFISLV